MKLKLLGISGKRGSGKSSVADIIRYKLHYHHPEVFVINFADVLKQVCNTLEGDSDSSYLEHYYTQGGKAAPSKLYGLSRGELLQQVGQAMRRWQPNIWVDATMAEVDELLPSLCENEIVLVADVRYENESEAVKSRGGFNICVVGDPLKQQGDGTRDDNHPSETALDDYENFDVVLVNNGTMEQLQSGVKAALNFLRDKGESCQTVISCAMHTQIFFDTYCTVQECVDTATFEENNPS